MKSIAPPPVAVGRAMIDRQAERAPEKSQPARSM